MAFQTIQVNLEFNANILKAKTLIQSLQQLLNNIVSSLSTSLLGLTPLLLQALQAAMQLKVALNNATNVDTGKLNLTQFLALLKLSGMTMLQLAGHMLALGPAGVKTFSQLTATIALADTRMFSLGVKAKSFLTSIAHSALYQMASSLIYGTINAFSLTLSYAKELDTSLNNIRIVTGKGADEMARFAKEASKMAKQLSTTTTRYSDASLIYFQLGLNDAEVKKRTDVTVKLANVVGESAQEVSEWMTAIWNNFDDGSVSLERYADVLAKLGAVTASSADEIAAGLEKFAAVAETVGLSYDYAASALATITAETRQSADVVGTALKTLFARIEGLKFGETLEDGTTLNQYSLALAKVGVDIKNANGELKDMDMILTETGLRWNTLAKDELVALAQSVAGIRLYTQFMALMDNWDVMEKNLELTEKSTGALRELQEIYEDSVEAAKNRMTTAVEEFKTLLVGGDDLAKVYNTLGGALEFVTDLTDAFGGLRGIIMGAAAVLLNLYQPLIATMFENMAIRVLDFGMRVKSVFSKDGATANLNKQFLLDTLALNSQMINLTTNLSGQGGSASIELAINEAYMERIRLSNTLTENLKLLFDWSIKILESYKPLFLELESLVLEQQKLVELEHERIEKKYGSEAAVAMEKTGRATGKAHHAAFEAKSITSEMSNFGAIDNSTLKEVKGLLSANLNQIKASYAEMGQELPESFKLAELSLLSFTGKGAENIKNLSVQFDLLEKDIRETNEAIILLTAANHTPAATQIRQEGVGKHSTTDELISSFEGSKIADGRTSQNKNLTTELKHMVKNIDSLIKAYLKSGKEVLKYSKLIENLQKRYQTANKAGKNTSKIELALTKVKLKLNAATYKQNTAEKKLRGGINALNKANGEAIITTETYTKKLQEAASMDNVHLQELAENATATRQLTEQEESLSRVLQDVLQKLGLLNGQMLNPPAETFASKLSKAIGAASSLAMAFNMLYSAGESWAELFSGDFSMGKLISALSSTLMSVTMLISGYMALIALRKANLKEIDKEIAKSGLKLAADIAETGVTITKVFAKCAEIIASSWGAGIGIALAALALLGAGIASSISASSTEKKEEDLSAATDNAEAINENQELAESVSDLTSEYKALKAAGESTQEVLDNMKDKIPELIDSYKELAKTLNTTIDLTQLEKAYQHFLETGDITAFEEAQKEVDRKVVKEELKNAKAGADIARQMALDVLSGGNDGRYEDGNYHVSIGGEGTDELDAAKLLSELFSDIYTRNENDTGVWGFGAGGKIKFDASTNAKFVEGYQKMLEAREALENLGLQDSDTYREINRELTEMKEHYDKILPFMDEFYNYAESEMLSDERSILGDYANISSLEEYKSKSDDIINHIKTQFPDITTELAEILLKLSKILGGFAEVEKVFADTATRTQLIAANMGAQGLEDVKSWYAGLSEDERTLFMGIDFSLVHSIEEALAALLEEWKKSQDAKIVAEAVDLEVDEQVFDNYVDNFAEANGKMDENATLTKKMALNNLKLQKGIDKLVKSWDNIFKILSKGNKTTIEYAEAMGELLEALETALGVKPSQDYVEQHLQKINRLVNGDIEVIGELQNALAKDYILNMEYKTSINNDIWSGTITEAQDTLHKMLNEMDTSIAIGKGSILSGDYLDELQKMLDAGVISAEQLDKIFTAKGYVFEVTDWKRVPGAKRGMTRTTYQVGSDGKKSLPVTEYIEETEEMLVPIINGKEADIKTGQAPAMGNKTFTNTIAKSTKPTGLNTSSIEDKAEAAKEQRDDLKDEKDRYHEINEIISDTERNLDKLSKAKDRAFGKNKVAAIKDEIKAQKELIKNNKELLKEAKDYLKIDQKELVKNTASNLAIQFDEYGRIANYEALLNSYIKRLKATAGTEQYEDIEKEYEQFKEAAERYEETLNKVEEQLEKVNDELDRLSELHVEEIETKVEIKVEIADDDKAYIDFLMQKTEDDAFAAAERIGNYGGYAKAALTKIDAAQEGIDDTQRKLEAGEITPAQAVELMREYRQELIDGNAELLEIRNNVQDELTGIFEAFHEEIENGIAKLEHYGAVLNGYKNIIDIVGKGMLGLSDETMNTLNKAIVSNANDTIRAVKAQKDANDKTIAEMKLAREEAAKRGDDASVKEWDKQIEVAEAKGRELTTNLQDALASGLQAAATAFGDTVDQIIDGFAKQVSGIYDSIEEMREAWDRSLEVADRYLQTYEQTYELNKLNRNIQKSIDSTDSLQAQKQLRGLLEEMYEMTKDGQQLSKYDLEYLQKKYDLLVAEQALKDAQNAKSVVRLLRDSEGNYGYVYTADQNAIDNAELAYEDKLYAYQKWSADMDKELTELYISVNEKYVENMAWVKENFILGTAEYQEHMDRVNREYQEDMAFITGENEKLINHNLDINQRFSAGVAATYKDTFLGQIQPNYNSFADLFAGTTDACEQATILLNAAVIGLRGTFDELFRLAGEDFDDFAKKADDKFGEILEDSSDTADEIEDLAEDMEIEMGNAIDAVEDFLKDYSKLMEKVRKLTDNTIKKVEALIEKYNKLIKKNNEANNLKTPTETKGSNKNNAINQTTNTSKTKKTSETAKTTVSNIAQTSAGIYYQVGKKWYAASDLSLPNQGHTEVGDIATVIKGENGKESPYQNISLKNASWDATDSSHVDMYNNNGKYQGTAKKLYINENNLANLQKKSIIGYKYYNGVNLYRLNEPWEVADNTGPTKTYWLRQKDLHELLNTVGHTAYSRLYNLKMFDTGGYTGDWGPEGRLAMLHQKEIVLNAHDTENLLTAVSMIREISSQLESNALAMLYIGSLGKVYSAIHTGGDTLQQEVHIIAEFPNATDHNEIEEAFKNLTNLASQYANRKS